MAEAESIDNPLEHKYYDDKQEVNKFLDKYTYENSNKVIDTFNENGNN